MTFNSWQFLIFFPVVALTYFLLKDRSRQLFLLIASAIFYMAFIPQYILILIFLILVDFFAGKLIAGAKRDKRKLYLLISLAANLGLLAVFKYFNFFSANVSDLFQLLRINVSVPLLDIILPIGLSFHTFQAMSYTIEVYRGRYPAEKDLLTYANYVMFFPQLVAGPIERPYNLLPQLKSELRFSDPMAVSGLRLMLWGLFKKAVVADKLALLVNVVYDDPTKFQGIPLILATLGFALQIYCDFSGYSDIAIGAAKVLGINLMENFRRPYFARTIGEFWQRWHISLSTWFRDYVYFPLGGNRKSEFLWVRNILIVFLLSGLWHGANWIFVIWGGLHGVYYLIFRILEKLKLLALIPEVIQSMATFVLVTVAWIFFRAVNISQAWYIFSHLTTGVKGYILFVLEYLPKVLTHTGTPIGNDQLALPFSFIKNPGTLPAIIMGILILLIGDWLLERNKLTFLISHAAIRWAAYLVGILMIMNLGAIEQIPFIYFQF